MTDQEYNEQVVKILGVKAVVNAVGVHLNTADHMRQTVILYIAPTEAQAKKIKALVRKRFCDEVSDM